jgi:hypothetical protein
MIDAGTELLVRSEVQPTGMGLKRVERVHVA